MSRRSLGGNVKSLLFSISSLGSLGVAPPLYSLAPQREKVRKRGRGREREGGGERERREKELVPGGGLGEVSEYSYSVQRIIHIM